MADGGRVASRSSLHPRTCRRRTEAEAKTASPVRAARASIASSVSSTRRTPTSGARASPRTSSSTASARTPSMYVSFGGEGALTWAGGFLGTPERGADYPRIGVDCGRRAPERADLDDRRDGRHGRAAHRRRRGGRVRPPTQGPPATPRPTPARPTSRPSDAATSEPMSAPVEGDQRPQVDPAVCDPAADCVPGTIEPIVVHALEPAPVARAAVGRRTAPSGCCPGTRSSGDDEGRTR